MSLLKDTLTLRRAQGERSKDSITQDGTGKTRGSNAPLINWSTEKNDSGERRLKMAFRWRPDGDYVREVPAMRRILPFIMRRRNESAVYFEQKVDTAKTGEFLRSFRERTGLHATLLHLLIWASGQILKERPRLNRFVAGGRIYQRRGIWISFSAKKEKTDDAPIVAVKRKIDPSWTFEDLVRKLESSIGESRRGKPSATSKELDLLFRLPTFLISRTVWFLMKLDQFGLLPETFIRSDPLFASIFIANLGSIKMDAGFHHLYEYGNIPIFMMAGQSKEEPVSRSRRQGGGPSSDDASLQL